jgi:DNA mismatch endonuclease (patch repair protein)
MADIFSKEKRSEIMSRIRSKNTGIEKKVFSYLRKRKIYFYQHYPKAPGKPDVALPSKKKAVMIHGDFWHGYRFSIWKNRIPAEYWREKIAGNMRRDERQIRQLRRQGWKVLKVWGHEIVDNPGITFKKIERFLK